jgi:FtsZ-interacting cell division protein YlmF
MAETGCSKEEADEFFLYAKQCLKEYVSDHIENFFDKTRDGFEDAAVSGDVEETTEKLELVADVLDEFLRNAEEEEMQGVPYVVYHTPRDLADAESIIDHICDLFTVIVDCNAVDPLEYERIHSFVLGAALANGARIVPSKAATFFVVPYHIDVPDEEVFSYIEEKGVAVSFLEKDAAE